MEDGLKVAIGSVLGDGCLKQLSKKERASQLYISQHESRLPYLEWLHAKLGEQFAVNPIKRKKGYRQFYFMTKPDKALGELMTRFYPLGKKEVPAEIMNLLVFPLSLAVWYMDDGTLDKRAKYHHNAMFATYGFSFDGCAMLGKVLLENFGVQASVSRCSMRGKVYPRLYVRSAGMNRFIDIVKPYVHPVFRYKIK